MRLTQYLCCIIINISLISTISAQDCDPFGFGGTPCPATPSTPTPAKPSPAPTPVQPTTPTEFSIPITIPVIGTVNLIPFTDNTQTPAVSGFKVKITKPNEKLTVGPATIDDGEISLIGGNLGMTGRLTIFGKQARFGIKDISLQSPISTQNNKKQATPNVVKRLVLTVTFLPESSTITFGGVTLPLGNADIILEQGKPIDVKTHVQADTLMPFTNSGIPVLNTLKFTNLDVQLDVTKNPKNKKLAPTIAVKGATEILGVKVSAVIREVLDANGKPGIYVNAPLPKNWKFSDSIKELKGTFFDGLIFNEAWLLACSVESYNDPDRNVTVKKGLSFYAQVPLSGSLDKVGKLLGSMDQTFTMYGKLDPNPRNINFGIILSQGVPLTTSTVSVGNMEVVISGEPHLGLKASVIVRPSTEDTLTFTGEFDLGVIATLHANMDGSWHNPFGIKGLTLNNVALGLGITYSIPPVPSLFQILADMKIKDNTVSFATSVDATLQHMALKGHVDRLSFMDIVTSFAQPIGLKLPQPAFPVFDLANVDIRFAAIDTTIGTQTIGRGITMIADMNVLNEKANVNVNVGGILEGIKIFGSIDPINIANVLKINGHNGAGKPEVDIELSFARQNFLIQGELSLANLYKVATYLTITTGGIEFDFLESINNNQLLYSHVHGQSSGSLSNPQFTVSIDFQQQLQQYIKDRVHDQFASAQHEIIDSINAAQHQVDTLKNTKADAQKRLEDAHNQVAKAEHALTIINQSIMESNTAFENAQKHVDSIQHDIDELKKWYYSLPKAPSVTHTYVLINKTPWHVDVCLNYHGESLISCRSDCWISIQPGERHDFSAGACCIKGIQAGTTNKTDGKVEGGTSPNLCGNGVWKIAYNATAKTLDINEASKENIFDSQVTRSVDFAARMAAYETALHTATGVLDTFKGLSSGTLITSKKTAQLGLTAALGFLKGVEQATGSVLQLSDDTAKTILEGAQQTGVGILQGGTWVANQTLGQFDITRIHYDGSLQDLSKGVLGNVLVEAKIIKPIQLRMSLDPRNIAGSVASVVTSLTASLKHTFVDPLTPHVNQLKANESTIQKAQQSLNTLKPPAEVAQAQAAAQDAMSKTQAAKSKS
ncbi:MAG: hypothetical protein ACHQVS_04855 [Candidatus Babeliales bacterium]